VDSKAARTLSTACPQRNKPPVAHKLHSLADGDLFLCLLVGMVTQSSVFKVQKNASAENQSMDTFRYPFAD
jgi:hypothetical protein